MNSDRLTLTFLGTGTSQGVPIIGCDCAVCKSKDPKDTRLRTSALVNYLGYNIVIDTGPDFRLQMLANNVRDIDAVLFTHAHKDHTAGLDDIRAFNFLHSKSIPIYSNSETLNQLKKEFSYVFDSNNDYPGKPKLVPHLVKNSTFKVGNVNVQPILGMHGSMEVMGFKIGPLAYITDMNAIHQHSLEKLIGINTLVINGLRHQKHRSHFSLSEAIDVGTQIDASQIFITHISHLLGEHKKTQQSLPIHVTLAYDRLVVEL